MILEEHKVLLDERRMCCGFIRVYSVKVVFEQLLPDMAVNIRVVYFALTA